MPAVQMRRMMKNMVRARRGSYCEDDMQEAVPSAAVAGQKRNHSAMGAGGHIDPDHTLHRWQGVPQRHCQ